MVTPDIFYDVPPAGERRGKTRADSDRPLDNPIVSHRPTLIRDPVGTMALPRQKNVGELMVRTDLCQRRPVEQQMIEATVDQSLQERDEASAPTAWPAAWAVKRQTPADLERGRGFTRMDGSRLGRPRRRAKNGDQARQYTVQRWRVVYECRSKRMLVFNTLRP
jgi:hypothetical protein